MTKYIRITENIAGKLNAKEAYLFYCLSLKADLRTHESDIKQETLAKEYGIKDTDQISDWLYHFQSCACSQLSRPISRGSTAHSNDADTNSSPSTMSSYPRYSKTSP